MATATAQNNKFNFFVPVTLEKGVDSDGKELIKIKGIASSNVEDSDGETLDPSGFDFAPLLQTGFLNWNHQAQKTSSAICGQPTAAKIINKGKDFYIEGFLYPNKEGKSVAELAETLEKYSPDRRLGFSIEGQATERDMFNQKKVKKAKVTGVAITQCPKNPNTLLSIMKGEYAEPLIGGEITDEEKEEEKKKTEKAMGVNIDVNPESVEGGQKKVLQPVGDDLKKSDIYDIIIDRYTQTAPLKDIYSFVNTVSQKLFNMATPNKESLEKAFSMLDEAQALVKGKDEGAASADAGGDDDKEKDKKKDKEEEGAEDKDKKPFEKGNPAAAEPPASPAELKKAKDTAEILHKAGMNEKDACDTMTKGGIAMDVAQGAYNSVVAEANAKKDGGDITALGGSLMKAMEDQLGKALEPIIGMGADLTAVKTSISKGFEGVRSAFDILGQSNEQLLKDNEELKKSQADMLGRLEAIESTPQGRKSVVARQGADRFEKSEDGQQALPPGTEAFNISDRGDLKRLNERISGELDIIKSKGGSNDMLEKCVESIEIAQYVPEEAYGHLRAMGIILQKSE